MNLSYRVGSGPLVTLQICHFLTFEQRPIYSEDGCDRIGTHFIVEVVAIWSPGSTASFNGQLQVPPDGQFGDGYALSIVTLRDYLLTPRGQLTVDVGGQVILSSPPSFAVLNAGGSSPTNSPDMDSGPRPISCRVTQFHGIGSAWVVYRIETTITEAATQESALVSNRWEMTENMTEDYLAILSIEGEARFNAAALAAEGLQPGRMRSLVLPPVPKGFQRFGLRVAQSSDKTRLRWSCRDEQQIYVCKQSSGIIRIRGRRRVEYSNGLGLFGLGSGEGYPSLTKTWSVEVWGRPGVNQTMLANAVLHGLSAGGADTNAVFINGFVEVDFPGRHAAGQISLARFGAAGTKEAVLGGSLAMQATGNADAMFRAAELDNPAASWVVWPASQQATAICPGPAPGVAPVDGVYTDAQLILIAQELYSPGSKPPAAVTAG